MTTTLKKEVITMNMKEFNNLASEIVPLLKLLDWTPKFTSFQLHQRYGKVTFCQLSQSELIDCRDWLKIKSQIN